MAFSDLSDLHPHRAMPVSQPDWTSTFTRLGSCLLRTCTRPVLRSFHSKSGPPSNSVVSLSCHSSKISEISVDSSCSLIISPTTLSISRLDLKTTEGLSSSSVSAHTLIDFAVSFHTSSLHKLRSDSDALSFSLSLRSCLKALLSLDFSPSSTLASQTFRFGEYFGFCFRTFLATVDPGDFLFFHEHTQFRHVVRSFFPICSRFHAFPLIL